MPAELSLRERKKKRRNQRVLKAAADLFKEKGYAETTISAIAQKADLGVGTIYNYFSSKNDILLSIVTNLCIEKKPAEIIYANDPVKTLCAYLNRYFEEFDVFTKDIWCGWFGALFSQERQLIEKAYQLDMKIVSEVSGLCEKMQARKMITAEIPALDIAKAVYTAFVSWMMSYFMLPEVEIEATKHAFERNVRLLFTGIKP